MSRGHSPKLDWGSFQAVCQLCGTTKSPTYAICRVCRLPFCPSCYYSQHEASEPEAEYQERIVVKAEA